MYASVLGHAYMLVSFSRARNLREKSLTVAGVTLVMLLPVVGAGSHLHHQPFQTYLISVPKALLVSAISSVHDD